MRSSRRLLLSVGAVLIIQHLAVLAGAGPVSGADQDGPQVLFWHLVPSESATPELVSHTERTIRSYFERRFQGRLLDVIAVDSLLLVEGNEKFQRCAAGVGCLAELGRAAKAPLVIAGEVAARKERLTVRLMLIDSQRKAVVSEARVEGPLLLDETMLEELGTAMFAPEQYRGSLDVTVYVPGAEIWIDGRKVGATPLAGPLPGVAAGKRVVEIRKQGYQPARLEVQVQPGRATKIATPLVMRPESGQAPTPESPEEPGPYDRKYHFELEVHGCLLGGTWSSEQATLSERLSDRSSEYAKGPMRGARWGGGVQAGIAFPPYHTVFLLVDVMSEAWESYTPVSDDNFLSHPEDWKNEVRFAATRLGIGYRFGYPLLKVLVPFAQAVVGGHIYAPRTIHLIDPSAQPAAIDDGEVELSPANRFSILLGTGIQVRFHRCWYATGSFLWDLPFESRSSSSFLLGVGTCLE